MDIFYIIIAMKILYFDFEIEFTHSKHKYI